MMLSKKGKSIVKAGTCKPRSNHCESVNWNDFGKAVWQ